MPASCSFWLRAWRFCARKPEISEQEKLINEIKALFSEKLLLQVDSVDTDLFDAGALDSLTLVDLLLHLEQQFGFSMSIENLDIENFRSIGKIAELVGAHKSAALRGSA